MLLGNGNGTFQTNQTYATGSGPSSVAIADVNGDGNPDIVVSNVIGNSVSVLLGNGNGTFQSQQTIAAGSFPISAALGDVNGDGIPDIVVTNELSNTVGVLLGNGNGTFQTQQTFATGVKPTSVALGDINGDGRTDLAVADFGASSVSLLLGNAKFTGQVYTFDTVAPFVQSINRASPAGPDTNASSVNFTVTFSKPVTGVNATDFQLALTGTASATVGQVTPVSGAVYTVTVSAITGIGTVGLNLADNSTIHDLAGNFLTQLGGFDPAPFAVNPTLTFATGNAPAGAAIADLNGDGIPDLVVVNAYSNSVSVLLGNGNGTFQAQQTFATGADPGSVTVGDVNGDGNLDLVVADFAGVNMVSVLLGNGNGTFQAQQTFATGVFPDSVALFDVNGDGQPDIVVAGVINNVAELSVLLGNGNGTFQAAKTSVIAGARAVVSDVNGDGIPDIVVTSQNEVCVLLGNGNGTFQAAKTYAVAYPDSVAVADVNGDGKPDIVVADAFLGTPTTQCVSVLLGNGNGTFQKANTFAAGSYPFSVGIADINGDGKPDILVENNAAALSWLPGNGDGTFQLPRTFAEPANTGPVALGDVNGDSRPDIILANNQTSAVSVLLNAANGNFTGQTYNLVSPAAATQFAVSATPASIASGGSMTVTVTAEDQFSETSYAYTGTVHFASTDSGLGVSLPADYTFVPGDNGVHVFTNSVTLATVGSQTVTVTDTTSSSITGNVVVTVVNSVKFVFVGLPTSVKAGTAVLLDVVAQDQAGNTATGYAGVVHFSSTDPQAQVPADTTLTGGIGVFAVELRTAGDQTFTATASASISNGTSPAILVSPVAASHFAIAVPTRAETGSPAAFTVTALDPYGNIAPSYAGTVHFSSSDSAATVPANSTLTGGVGVFSATLETSGSTTITATDTAGNLSAVSAPIAVRGLIVTGLSPTPTGFIATFAKPFDPTTLSLYSAPDDVVLVNGSGHVVRGSLVLNTAAGAPPDTSFTFVATSGVLPAGTYTVTLISGASGIKDASGVELDGIDSGNAGNNYVTTFTVASTPSLVLSIPDFARGPDSAANILLPNATGSGIPITLTGAANLTAATFSLTVNPALLNISGTLNGPSGTFTLQSYSGGVASFAFSSGTPLSGTFTLGYLVAQVPNSAVSSYKTKALLHLGNIVINGSNSTAVNSDGIEAVAYLGDVAGTGSFSPLDAALISQVAVGIDSGFSAFEQLDPAIIGDVSSAGNINSSDVTLMNRLLAGITAPQVPLPPTGLIIPPTGPDPTLSLGSDVPTTTGGAVTVPVNIDTARPAGSSGIMEATLALRYNPQLYSLTAADIKLGTVPMPAPVGN